MPAVSLRLMLSATALLLALLPVRAADDVRFGVDVMAVLSKAGCNQGACHGNLNGKGGFKLSLRGEDPDWDFAVLTRGMLGRRIDRMRPEQSLILLKPTAQMPHEGGKRFDIGTAEYDILRRWIAAGTPFESGSAATVQELIVQPKEYVLYDPSDLFQIRVQARFSNGPVKDVTRLAVYEASNPMIASISPEGTVTRLRHGETAISVRFLNRQTTVRLASVPARPDFRWSDPPENNFIDRHIFAKLRTLRMNPSDLCDDPTFLRRVHLDLLGMLPTPEESRAFLADHRADKRSRLADALLLRPEYADYWALKWSDLLRNEEKQLDRKGVQSFHSWIRQSIADGKPLNEFARELIAARGSTYSEPAANYYRALRDPLLRAEATAQVFLGLRLQCCRCHNHPFDQWTQNDYYELAAFFPRIQYRIVENNRKDKFDQHEFDGEQIVWLDRSGEITHPRTGQTMLPKFLGYSGSATGEQEDRLQALADWVASPGNPFFARTQVNRVWFHLLGHGLVDPDDDFRATNPPSHPELLDALSRDFAAHHFDLRHAIRTIVNSRTYQLSALPNATNREDELNCSHAQIRRLEAEPLLDAVAQVSGVPIKFAGQSEGLRAVQLPGVQLQARGKRSGGPGMSEKFMKTFGKPERLLSCDCERSNDTTVLQAFQMISGEMIGKLLREPDNRIGKLLQSGKSDSEMLDELYLAALCRYPSAAEVREILPRISGAAKRRAAWEDVLWALLNAKEFLLRR
ncbi:MAG TPA: DUF1549 and DUF1553 domain-containing protein [Gemmataceae bacterium]|jgi:hypothetical protein|nr:DUF1549 and DUF1553 domain-containing protein [Gemmataceae bacterium]